MKNQTAYDYLAEWFEYLNDDCGYENWSQYFIGKLKRYGVYKGLDVGCGSGYFTRAFFRAGFDMTGMDISLPMLTKAEALSKKEGVNCPYILGDIVKFTSPQKYDFMTAINDCINYVPKTKLASAFQSVKRGLKAGGIFLFDFSSKKKFEEKLTSSVSVDDREDVTYLAFNKRDGDVVTMDVSLFVKKNASDYVRFDEKHTQYVYTLEEVQVVLEESGFTVIETFGHLGESLETTDRICVIARKK